jgi:hypothetical protein
MQRHLISVLGIVIALITGGCSGETTTSAPTSGSAEGLWSGSTNTNRTVAGVVLDDDTYYLLYSVATNPNLLAGVVQGTGTSNNGSFDSADAKDFNMEGLGVRNATVSASYASRQFLNGSITYSGIGGTTTFTSTYNTAYDTTPTLASLAGLYTGQAGSSGGLQSANVTVASDGGFRGGRGKWLHVYWYCYATSPWQHLRSKHHIWRGTLRFRWKYAQWNNLL